MTSKRGMSGAVAAALAVVMLIVFAVPASAELQVDINRGKIEPMPIAVPPFSGGGEAGQVGGEMAGVIANDLKSSGLFRPLDARSFIQNVSTGEAPRFGDWRLINARRW